MKNGKAAGCDNIPPEAWKEEGLVSAKVLHPLLNKIWSADDIPRDWKLDLLVKLPKKGDLNLCNNWRGIMLLTISSKVLCRIILERMKDALDNRLWDEQAGFRKERSCCDQMATLRIIVKQTLEWNTSLYIVFIDFEKVLEQVTAFTYLGSLVSTTGGGGHTEVTIPRRKWGWIGHTLRKPATNISRQSLEWNPQGSRKRGRPKKSWRRTVQKEFENIGLSWEAVKRTAQNRVPWKSAVEALCSGRSEED